MPDHADADARTPSDGRVLAVMTAYHPDADTVTHARSILAEVDELTVVDDGSGPDADRVLAAISAAGARVVRQSSNTGIAAAVNAGIAASGPRDDDVLIFFDQDSAIPPGFVAALQHAVTAGRRDGVAVAGAAPEFFSDVRQGSMGRDGVLRVEMPIQSGLLVTAEALATVGGMREDLFIDLVDDEFALRIADAGMTILGAPALRLPHRLGRQVAVPVFGRPLAVRGRPLRFTVSAPFRYYYRSRNRVLVSRAHRRGHRARLLLDTLLEARHYLIAFAAVQQRSAFRRILRAGRRDGRRGTGGPIPPDVRRLAEEITWRMPL